MESDASESDGGGSVFFGTAAVWDDGTVTADRTTPRFVP